MICLLKESVENDGLGLSLRVASSCGEEERGGGEAAEKREEMMGRLIRATETQSNNNNTPGIMNHIPNKRARVSVRARCESATVSSTILI